MKCQKCKIDLLPHSFRKLYCPICKSVTSSEVLTPERENEIRNYASQFHHNSTATDDCDPEDAIRLLLDEIDSLRNKLADIHIDAYKAREANTQYKPDFLKHCKEVMKRHGFEKWAIRKDHHSEFIAHIYFDPYPDPDLLKELRDGLSDIVVLILYPYSDFREET